jgi:hypothetical protein
LNRQGLIVHRKVVAMTPEIDESDARREFLKTCGRFAAVTPPALTMLLSTSLNSSAVAASMGRSGKGNNGFGNGGNDGSPNGEEDTDR